MSRRRSFGSVRRLPSGRWQARYPGPEGQLVPAPTTFPTKGDAARYLAGVEVDQGRGLWLDPRAGQTTLDTWAADWLLRPAKRRNTLARDRQALAKYLPSLGHRTLGSLTPALIGIVVREEAGKVAPATAARDLATLRAVLNAAVEAELIARSPLRGIRLAVVVPPERPTLAPVQLAALAAAIEPRFRALVLLGGWLGLRWSEAIALQVADVDFDRQTLTISRTLSEVGGHLELDETKSRSSRRTLAIPSFLSEELIEHLAKHRPSASPTDLVFVGRNGAPLRRTFAARHFGPAVTAAGLDPRLTFTACATSPPRSWSMQASTPG